MVRSHEEVERLLLNEIDRTRAEFERLNEEFHRRGSSAGICGALNSVMDAYASALLDFNTFCIDGSIPERLKNPRRVTAYGR
jgi:hypothetical protein